MKVDRADEGRIRVGTRGWVRYLDPRRRIPITVTEIRLRETYPGSGDWHLMAACTEAAGDMRWYFLHEIHTESDHDGC